MISQANYYRQCHSYMHCQFYFFGKGSKCIYLIKWDLRVLGKSLNSNVFWDIIRILYLLYRVFQMENLIRET